MPFDIKFDKMSSMITMRLSRQFQVCWFFYRKVLSVKKATKRKTHDFHPLRSFCALKMLPLLFFVRVFLFCLLIFACECFLPSKPFRKKTINRLEIVLITSLYYTTDVLTCSKIILKSPLTASEYTAYWLTAYCLLACLLASYL